MCSNSNTNLTFLLHFLTFHELIASICEIMEVSQFVRRWKNKNWCMLSVAHIKFLNLCKISIKFNVFFSKLMWMSSMDSQITTEADWIPGEHDVWFNRGLIFFFCRARIYKTWWNNFNFNKISTENGENGSHMWAYSISQHKLSQSCLKMDAVFVAELLGDEWNNFEY